MDIDQKLYKEFLAGNMKSFDTLVDKYRNIIVSFINTYVKEYDVSEDLAQDVFVYVLINRKEYDFKYSMKTYFYTIARCRAINYLKRKNKIVYMDECYINDVGTNITEEQLLINDERKSVYRAIERLNSNQQKKVLYLADIEDMSYKEVARILDISLSQVKMTLHRARKCLKNILEMEEIKNG